MTGARRRGEELEHALLTAAWAELLEVGYPKLTMENVAARAGTSKPVIYRRWPTRAKLVIAALAHNLPLKDEDIDTGSLRGDLLEVVGRGIRRYRRMPGDTLPGLITETFRDPEVFAELRSRLRQGEVVELIRPLLTRAVQRGELRTDQISDRVLRLPFDLLRTEAMLYGVLVDDLAITEIIDDIVLPLLELHCGTPARNARHKHSGTPKRGFQADD
ncbi:TetR/AcrR family transcriptional regulator [Kutzneria sp. CA-103260]|uniref:TetR/AcrR family transcriptional regulator n=1 Tax=Kutzneria sp. CA-103260 TaxID=2802641 RepID=UPI001BA9FF0F|nr:TetR/AcrR family transcriptional regulator [Kutzneria sp. CA-103260]QUQ67639.1 TetR family transcriptional regulator [Kutzneria sp. CA-103260]